jgi:hypothetical protein
VLDFDGTDMPVHGDQPSKFFNAYYDHHCYFPLYIFCGRHLLVSYLLTSNRSDSRQYWPDTRIVFRGDSGLHRPRLLSWCDRNNVDYLVGISKNSRLIKEVGVPSMLVRKAHHELGKRSLPPTGSSSAPVTTTATNFITSNTAPGATRKTESKISSYACLPIAPPVLSGGPTSSG